MGISQGCNFLYIFDACHNISFQTFELAVNRGLILVLIFNVDCSQ